jgi:pimeloyl-ACP methyl ester carboxylesterase
MSARPRTRQPAVLVLLACVPLALAGRWPAAADASRQAVIIYSHGTTRPQALEDCNASYNRVPPSLTQLEKAGAARIVFLCSKATDGNGPGSYIYKRAREIRGEVDRLRAAGVPARRIFLAGHSAGAWSSLMFMREHAERINAAILFAPACCGPRSEIALYPWWRRTIQPRQVAEITSGKRISALVFAYPDDRFDRPEDIEFLSKAFPKSVTVIPVACGAGHRTHLNDCRFGQTTEAIGNYLAERLLRPE